jgi:CubicO group peptidase (beta-lactamase class C family)
MRRLFLVLPTILILGFVHTVPASQTNASGHTALGATKRQAATHSAPRIAQLTSGAQVNAYLIKHHFHGYVDLARHGRTILSKGYGLADVTHRAPNTVHTRWPMFGIEGFMVAIAILKLQEQGKLTVNDRLCSHLSRCPAGWGAMTIAEMLDDRSGIGHYDANLLPGNIQHTIRICESLPLQSPPGTPADQDSACNRVLLSTVIAKVSGKPFGTTMRELIFGPAGMTSTSVVTRQPGGSARGYVYGAPGQRVYFSGYPLIYSTVTDLQRLDRSLIAGKLISPPLKEMLFVPRTLDPGGSSVTAGYGSEAVLARNKYPIWDAGDRGTQSQLATFPFKTNRVVEQGGGPDGSGFDVHNAFSPDDGALFITMGNDTGFLSSTDHDALKDVIVRLLWAT